MHSFMQLKEVFLMMDFKRLAESVLTAPGNFISKEVALLPELIGMRIYDTPIFGVADASDPLFTELPTIASANLPYFRGPTKWLPEAKRVISFFLPFSKQVKTDNMAVLDRPSESWVHGRIDGQKFIAEYCTFLQAELEANGAKAVVPLLSPDFWAVKKAGSNPNIPDQSLAFSSCWSERHVAYICGLGTFSLSKGLITKKGVCGRFGSLVTDAELPVTPRTYSGLYDYCIMCGACAHNCPVGAIDKVHGKDHYPCTDFVGKTELIYGSPY